ncbi:MAG: YggS family pyridoxal phosphate-dependent enzyme [Kiritimatiellia bacterium]
MNESIAERVNLVRERIEAACRRARRSPEDVTLLAVAKGFGPDEVSEAARAGITVIGENRVQEARQKIPLCPAGVEWHMIGHLQTNKVGWAVRLFQMIQSVDSVKLLEKIDAACRELGVCMPVCLEVNLSGESRKFGFAPSEVPRCLEVAARTTAIEVVGLMTIPPFTPDSEGARPFFARLRELRDEWRKSTGFALPMLSMGMSHDFEVAIEEGATCVRIGTALFGPRKSWTRTSDQEET